jgi:hypothetical protein
MAHSLKMLVSWLLLNPEHCLFVFHGRPRQATDVPQPSWFFCTFWTFQLWPPDAPAPTDAFRTLAAEVGNYGRGIRTGNLA